MIRGRRPPVNPAKGGAGAPPYQPLPDRQERACFSSTLLSLPHHRCLPTMLQHLDALGPCCPPDASVRFGGVVPQLPPRAKRPARRCSRRSRWFRSAARSRRPPRACRARRGRARTCSGAAGPARGGVPRGWRAPGRTGAHSAIRPGDGGVRRGRAAGGARGGRGGADAWTTTRRRTRCGPTLTGASPSRWSCGACRLCFCKMGMGAEPCRG